MQENRIYLTDVLNILKSQTDASGNFITHDISFISYDRKKTHKNGRYIELAGVYMVRQKNEWENQIRGFRCIATGNITAVHIRLIKTFNNLKVIW